MITITDPMKGVSHRPGQEVLLPGTCIALKIFPTKIEYRDLMTGRKAAYSWHMPRSIHPFTIEQDIDHRKILVYGEGIHGYFRLCLQMQRDDLCVHVEKAPDKECSLCKLDTTVVLKQVLSCKEPFQERLFLGCSKQKNLERIRERVDLCEILPYWFALGQITPVPQRQPIRTLQGYEPVEKVRVLQEMYIAALSSGFVPTAWDEEHLGIVQREQIDPLHILPSGAELIRSFFFQEEGGQYYFLPDILPPFVAGKMTSVRTKCKHLVDIEWTKHKPRRICIKLHVEDSLYLHFPKEIKRCRCQVAKKDRGHVLISGACITGQAGDVIWLDRFEK